jgi:hypothetical protein
MLCQTNRITIPRKSRLQIALDAKENEQNQVVLTERRLRGEISHNLIKAETTMIGCRTEIAKVIKLFGA